MEDQVVFFNEKSIKIYHIKTNKTHEFELENSIQLCKPIPSEFAGGC